MISESYDPSAAELARRVADAYKAREALANTRPSLFQFGFAYAWFMACGAAFARMNEPLLVKTLLFCAVSQVPAVLIEMTINRRRLQAAITLLEQAQSEKR